jgi:hypothetical protein
MHQPWFRKQDRIIESGNEGRKLKKDIGYYTDNTKANVAENR